MNQTHDRPQLYEADVAGLVSCGTCDQWRDPKPRCDLSCPCSTYIPLEDLAEPDEPNYIRQQYARGGRREYRKNRPNEFN